MIVSYTSEMNPIFDVTNLNNPIDFGRWGFFIGCFLKWHQYGTKAKTENPKRLDFIEFFLVEHTGLELV